MATPFAALTFGDVPEWMRVSSPDAVCAQTDPELWFPEQGQRSSVVAKRLCQGCPLMQACREWALARPDKAEFGVWGGLTEHERRMLRRQRSRDLAITGEAA